MRFFRLFSPGRILLIGTITASLYLIVSAGSNAVASYRLQSDEENLRQEVVGLQRQQDELRQIRDYLRTDDYVEFIARRVFGLVKPGESLVIVDGPPPVEQPSQSDAVSSWWQRLFAPGCPGPGDCRYATPAP